MEHVAVKVALLTFDATLVRRSIVVKVRKDFVKLILGPIKILSVMPRCV